MDSLKELAKEIAHSSGAIRNRIAEDIRNADGIISSRRHVW